MSSNSQTKVKLQLNAELLASKPLKCRYCFQYSWCYCSVLIHTSPSVLVHCGGVWRSLCQHAVEVTLELHQPEPCSAEFSIFTYFFSVVPAPWRVCWKHLWKAADRKCIFRSFLCDWHSTFTHIRCLFLNGSRRIMQDSLFQCFSFEHWSIYVAHPVDVVIAALSLPVQPQPPAQGSARFTLWLHLYAAAWTPVMYSTKAKHCCAVTGSHPQVSSPPGGGHCSQ